MSKSSANELKRGQTISFRIPSDTPDHILKQLQKLKETERRNFSSKMAEFVMQGVNSTSNGDRELVTIPLPKRLNKVQRDWLKHEYSEALLGSIFYQLISDPIRAATLLASLNSNSLNIDEALYLQEEWPNPMAEERREAEQESTEPDEVDPLEDVDDDLADFDWEKAKQQEPKQQEEDVEEVDAEDLLGGFLAAMNK